MLAFSFCCFNPLPPLCPFVIFVVFVFSSDHEKTYTPVKVRSRRGQSQ
jgi:hypothetical protein